MDATGSIIGSFFIVIALLIYRFPNLIAGYNTLSKNEKQKVNIEGLKRLVSGAFVIFGLFIIAITYMFIYFDMEYVAGDIIPIAIPIFVVILAILANMPKCRR